MPDARVSEGDPDTTVESLRDDAARCVMGWTLAPHQWAYSAVAMAWHDAHEVPLLARHAWRPDEDDRQCMQVLDRMTRLGFDYVIAGQGGQVTVRFLREGMCECEASNADRRVALLLAACGVQKRSSSGS